MKYRHNRYYRQRVQIRIDTPRRCGYDPSTAEAPFRTRCAFSPAGEPIYLLRGLSAVQVVVTVESDSRYEPSLLSSSLWFRLVTPAERQVLRFYGALFRA